MALMALMAPPTHTHTALLPARAGEDGAAGGGDAAAASAAAPGAAPAAAGPPEEPAYAVDKSNLQEMLGKLDLLLHWLWKVRRRAQGEAAGFGGLGEHSARLLATARHGTPERLRPLLSARQQHRHGGRPDLARRTAPLLPQHLQNHNPASRCVCRPGPHLPPISSISHLNIHAATPPPPSTSSRFADTCLAPHPPIHPPTRRPSQPHICPHPPPWGAPTTLAPCRSTESITTTLAPTPRSLQLITTPALQLITTPPPPPLRSLRLQVHGVDYYAGIELNEHDWPYRLNSCRLIRGPCPEEDGEGAVVDEGAERADVEQLARVVDDCWAARATRGDPIEAKCQKARVRCKGPVALCGWLRGREERAGHGKGRRDQAQDERKLARPRGKEGGAYVP